jgi:class 3 adenylate cyclase
MRGEPVCSVETTEVAVRGAAGGSRSVRDLTCRGDCAYLRVMAELPSGTVTFLFTDIEGSTRLLTRLRGRYLEILAEHQRLLRGAFNAYGGREVHTEGDAFFVAFARASDAIAAAVAGQRALASESWPEGVKVRVRMGVHTGEAAISMDDYVGLDVHRAARICSAGHGGQVVVSNSSRALVADDLPQDASFSDLGEHRLKDLDRPEHLFQVVAGDLRRHFPRLSSMSPGSGGANGLPPRPNRTIGRDDDVRAIADRLSVRGVRLLTLTGPGGVGKTRLGLEAARAVKGGFADGAYFVSLAALRRPEDVPAAIVDTLAIVMLSGESADQAAERFLAAKRLLLVVDNFEHLLAAAPFIGRLLDACPALAVLATSREPLSLHAEERYPVSPLAVPARATPEDAATLAGVDAVALFCERVRAGDPGFGLAESNAAAVAEICRTRSVRNSGSAANSSSLDSPAKASSAWPRSPRSTTTPTAQPGSPAPPPPTATTHHRTKWTPGSTRPSSSPYARPMEQKPGMPPRATAPR